MLRRTIKMKKRSQVKFGETIGIIVIVYLIIMVGLVWYNNVNKKSVQELYAKDQESRAFEKYFFVVNSDILHVSERGIISAEFDLHSMVAFSEFAQTEEGQEYLESRLGDGVIQLQIYYDHQDLTPLNQDPIFLYNKTPKQEIRAIQSFKTIIPVVDTLKKKTYLGILDVQIPII